MRWVGRWRTAKQVAEVLRGMRTMGTAEVSDCLERSGHEPGEWVLVDSAAWFWLCDWADDPTSVLE